MELIEEFQLNIYTLFVLLILFIAVMKRIRIETYGKSLLFLVIILTTTAVIIEPLTWKLDGQPSTILYILEYFTNVINIMLAPIIAGVMLRYVQYFINKDRVPIWRQIVLFPPTIFTAIIMIINLFYPLYFDVDSVTHLYESGSVIWIHYVMIFVIYIYMVTIVFTHRKNISKNAMSIFYIFFLVPLIGMLIQTFEATIFMSWTSIALSILVVFIFLESTDGETDYMTKLFNRSSYEKYITYLIERTQQFSIIYIDLDQFKKMNDEYGHLAGDKVLIGFSEHLEQVFHESHMIARLGGDEYMIVIEKDTDIQTLIEVLKTSLLYDPDKMIKQTHFSYGIESYKIGMTIDELYSNVDAKMYQYKRENKLLNRRKSDKTP